MSETPPTRCEWADTDIPPILCGERFNCCDCGGVGGGYCGCPGCWSCNACEHCNEDTP